MNIKRQTVEIETLETSQECTRTGKATEARKQLAQALKDIVWPVAIRLLRETPKISSKSLGKRVWRRSSKELLRVPRRAQVTEQTVINLISRKEHRRALDATAALVNVIPHNRDQFRRIAL